ncbi:hypothetical protein HID58_068381 [Brassica napus]|uniref:Nop domain-containing protein n=3 Tax=Brassica TaxID=3705 RepID=A0ABQ7ZLS6_BRANA|nr:hypothetical protein HID58_068381 [Brassica napus]CDY52879.1 BnaCnng23670D [Brassica napus]
MVCDSQLWPSVATYDWVRKLAITLSAIAVDTLFFDPWTFGSVGSSSSLLSSFHPSESALNQINAVYLKIGSCIFEATKIPCQSNEFVHELLRGVGQHFDRFIKDLKIVNDNYLYARVSKVIEDKSKLSEEHIPMLTDILGDEDKAKEILGAEKALFRALKTRGNTPKYGLIFHSSFIGRASAKNKGRIARYLANKCSVASRIDCFADSSTTAFGEKLREQVEERLEFYDKGVAPRKNVDVMKEVLESLEKKDEGEAIAVEASEKNKKKDKRKTEEKDEGEDGEKSTKKKKSKTVEEELTSHRRKRRRKLSHKVKNIPRQVSVM